VSEPKKTYEQVYNELPGRGQSIIDSYLAGIYKGTPYPQDQRYSAFMATLPSDTCDIINGRMDEARKALSKGEQQNASTKRWLDQRAKEQGFRGIR